MIFCLVNYNTTQLTTCACLSILKQHPDAKFIIFDNSDKEPFVNNDLFDLEYIDNTKGQIINFDIELKKYPNRTIAQQKSAGVNFGSAKHCMSIQWLINYLNDPIILCDTDILLKKKIDFIDDTKLCVGDVSDLHKDKNIYRLIPFITYLNIPLIKKFKIKFFDGKRMHGLTTGRGFYYDTGASFYEDLMKFDKKSFKKINFNDYIIHFKAGSWKTFDKNLLLENKKLWM